MGSKESHLTIRNFTNESFTIAVTQVDSYDWDGRARPDVNFEGVTIGPQSSEEHREELNKHAKSAWFRMTLTFTNGRQVTFRANQYNAIDGIKPNPRNYDLEGPNADIFGMSQMIESGPTNVFSIGYRSNTLYTSNWMRGVNGSLRISQFSIPGTHNSVANRPSAGPFQTQTYTIPEQLKYGVRYFDLAGEVINGRIVLRYGDVYDYNRIDQTFHEFLDFLDKNPTEAIIVSLADITNGKNPNFGTIVATYLAQYGNRIHKSDTIPTLEQIRGKIAIVRRFPYSGVLGMNLSSGWPENGSATIRYDTALRQTQSFSVQNVTVTPTIDQKWADVQNLFKVAATPSNTALCLNVTGVNPASAGMNLYSYAAEMNTRVAKYFNGLPYKNKVNGGVVLLDYADFDVLWEIITDSWT